MKLWQLRRRFRELSQQLRTKAENIRSIVGGEMELVQAVEELGDPEVSRLLDESTAVAHEMLCVQMELMRYDMAYRWN